MSNALEEKQKDKKSGRDGDYGEITALFLHMQHFILWSKYWIPRVFSQLGWRCHPGDKCRLTALLCLKQKQETSQHISRKQTHLDTRKAADLRNSFSIFDRSRPQSSQMEVWDHTAPVKQRGKSGEAVLLDRGTGSEVKGQTTENQTPSKSQSCLGGWELST